MNPNRNDIPGLRRPTSQEHRRILELWQEDFQNERKASSAGTVLKVLGFVLLGMCAATLFAAGENLGNFILVAAIGVLLVFLGNGLNNKVKQETARRMKIAQGMFLVAPAMATRYSESGQGSSIRACCRVRLSDGRDLPVLCKAPVSIVRKMIFRKIYAGPILVIVIDEEKELLSVPVE